ncbi:MAG: T9SS type A sorting domain-containing protein, partial [Bacteroidales bacterium]
KLTVTGAINNTAKGPAGLVIASGASFIHNTVDLPATVQRNLTNVWHLFGSPFKKNTGAMLANITGTTQMMPYTNGTGWGTTTTSPVTLFVPSVGYAIKPSATITASFTGNLYYSAIPADYTTSLIYNGTSATQSWNLVANPYTASIDFNLLGKTNLSSTLYYWDNAYKPNVTPIASASYMRTYNSCNGVGVPAGTLSYIAPLQGFFVKAVYTSPKLAFTPSARLHKPITYYKDASNTEILVRLKTETEEGSDELVICKNNNSKLDFEQFDSEKLFNDSPVEIYSQSTSGENLVINTINATANNIIPLGIRGNAGKKVKITAFALETAEQVYLEDRFKGKLISLTENTAYEFELPTESLIGRFFIRFNNTNAALTTSDVKVFENDNELNIIAQTGEELQTIEVYSLTGACVYKTVGNSNVFKTKLQLAPAVYMVRVKTSIATQNVKVSWK